jgi:hypothetical protein
LSCGLGRNCWYINPPYIHIFVSQVPVPTSDLAPKVHAMLQAPTCRPGQLSGCPRHAITCCSAIAVGSVQRSWYKLMMGSMGRLAQTLKSWGPNSGHQSLSRRAPVDGRFGAASRMISLPRRSIELLITAVSVALRSAKSLPRPCLPTLVGAENGTFLPGPRPTVNVSLS